MIGNKPKGGFLYYVTCILMHQSSTNSIHLREFFSLKNLREVTLSNSYIETKVCSDYKPLEQILIPSTFPNDRSENIPRLLTVEGGSSEQKSGANYE